MNMHELRKPLSNIQSTKVSDTFFVRYAVNKLTEKRKR